MRYIQALILLALIAMPYGDGIVRYYDGQKLVGMDVRVTDGTWVYLTAQQIGAAK